MDKAIMTYILILANKEILFRLCLAFPMLALVDCFLMCPHVSAQSSGVTKSNVSRCSSQRLPQV